MKSLSATADATKYGRLCIASTRSFGRRLPPTVFRFGPATRIFATSPGATFASRAALTAASTVPENGWAPGQSLTARNWNDVPVFPEIGGEAFSCLRAAAKHFRETSPSSQDVVVHRVSAAGGQRRIHGTERCVRAHVLARPAVRANREAAHRDRRNPQRLCHLFVGQFEELRSRDRSAECDDLRGVDAAAAAATRVTNAARGLVADHHREQHILAGRAGMLRDSQASGRERRAFVCGVADVAVVRRGGIAERGIDACDLVRGSFVPSNQIVACGFPPCSFARSRRMRAEPMSEPGAALAKVLARIIFACSTAFGGRSLYLVLLRNRVSSSARLAGALHTPPPGSWRANASTGRSAMPRTPPAARAPRRNVRRLKSIRSVRCSECHRDHPAWWNSVDRGPLRQSPTSNSKRRFGNWDLVHAVRRNESAKVRRCSAMVQHSDSRDHRLIPYFRTLALTFHATA